MRIKKITALLLSAAMLTFMAGCGTGGKQPVAMTPGGDSDTETSADEPREAADDEPADELTGEEAKEPVQTSRRYYSLNYNDSMLYVVDEDGDLENKYDLTELAKKLTDKFPGVGLEAGDYSLYYDGILYFTNYRYDAKNSEGSYGAIYAIDPESGEAVEVVRVEDYISSLDAYNGKLIFTYMPSGYQHFVEQCYDIKGGLKYEEGDSGLDAYYKATEDYDSCRRTSFGVSDCALRRFDEVGFDIVKKDQALYKAKMDGSLTKLYEADPDKTVNVDYFDSGTVIFHVYTEDRFLDGYYKIDLQSEETRLISDDEELSFVAFDKDYCYYTKDVKKCLDMYTRQLYSYDPDTGSGRLVMEESTVPGTGTTDILSPYKGVFASKFFVPLFEDDKYVWNVIDPGEADPSPRSLGYEADTFSVFDYGTVEYASSEYDCPDCGTTLNMFYGEKFVLNAGYSDHADEINKTIAQFIDGINNTSSNSLMFADTTCEEHQEYPEMSCETTEYAVSDVSVIEDKYLTVSYSGYYFTGGAHGEPVRDQFLFDLTTGQRIQLSELYTGTEEQFKELVAGKVKEDFETAEAATYFAETADEAYQQAYESAKLDDRAVFTEGGIDYMFYPYDLGPYSSGFITVHVSYQELLGRSTLSEQ